MSENTNAITVATIMNEQPGTMLCSIQPEPGNKEQAKKLYNAMNNPTHKVSDFINKTIFVENVLIEINDILDEETGEIDGDDSQRKVDANVSGYEVLPQNESEDYSYNADNSDYIPQDSDVPPEDDFNPQVSSVDDEIF